MVEGASHCTSTQGASRRRAGPLRIVAVLFCGVVGSTALAEQFDPEDCRSESGFIVGLEVPC